MAISLKEELLRSGNVMFTNKGVSMRPFIREGKDLMIIEKRTPEMKLKKGDAVLFERPSGALVLHRIYKSEQGGFLILGDNCLEPEYVEDERVLGLLTAVVRDGKERKDVSDKAYKRKVNFWTGIYPARKLVMRAKRKLGLAPYL